MEGPYEDLSPASARYLYQWTNQLSWWLLGAKDFSDFSSRMFLLQKIISRDLAMMDTIMKETAEIEARQKELDTQMADIEKMRSDLDEKQQKAEASKEERAQLLYRLKKKVARLMKIMTAYLPFWEYCEYVEKLGT